jgi:histidine ammonia-lyase
MLDPRLHRLRRQPGQIEVAAALRALLGEAAAPAVADMLPDHGCRPEPLGACLDLLRAAGRMLEAAANAVGESRLVFWQSGETAHASDDASAVAAAADLVALALGETAALAERGVAALAARSGGADAEAGAAGMARAFAGEVRERERPAGLDAAGVRRLLPMVGTATLIVAVEALAAARALAGEPARMARLPEPMRLLVQALPAAEAGITADVLAAAAELVRSGTLAAAPGAALPPVVPAAEPPRSFRPAARRR